MGKRGPPDKIALALQAMEQHVGHVNISEFARQFDVERLKVSRAWRRLKAFQSEPQQENRCSGKQYCASSGRRKRPQHQTSIDERREPLL